MGSHLLTLLTAANFGLLGIQSLQAVYSAAPPDVLRARALEIVDQRGKVRASIAMLPEDPRSMWRGKPYPETVLLRLITAERRFFGIFHLLEAAPSAIALADVCEGSAARGRGLPA